jgi:hypothetical protein
MSGWGGVQWEQRLDCTIVTPSSVVKQCWKEVYFIFVCVINQMATLVWYIAFKY